MTAPLHDANGPHVGTVDTDLAFETAVFWAAMRDLRTPPDPHEFRISLDGMHILACHAASPRLRRLSEREIERLAAKAISRDGAR